uniref:Putative secreted protein n=1 Tax=Ixodes ricinus TaxID=34613 RepID=A0A6B0UNP8_IXORI
MRPVLSLCCFGAVLFWYVLFCRSAVLSRAVWTRAVLSPCCFDACCFDHVVLSRAVLSCALLSRSRSGHLFRHQRQPTRLDTTEGFDTRTAAAGRRTYICLEMGSQTHMNLRSRNTLIGGP